LIRIVQIIAFKEFPGVENERRISLSKVISQIFYTFATSLKTKKWLWYMNLRIAGTGCSKGEAGFPCF
jgi:hypothetical protein